MINYQATMTHDENTFKLLARKRYDLFHKGNLVGRTIISGGALVLGVMNFETWWGVVLIVYSSYMTSSKYASADHIAKKMVKGIKEAGLEFPTSRYLFRDNAMEVIGMPENVSLGDPVMYDEIQRIAEDAEYFYIFPNAAGGYMMPKAQLGKQEDDFRRFLEEKTKKPFEIKTIPLIRFIRKFIK